MRVKNLIGKINEINNLITKNYCIDKDILKSIIKKDLDDIKKRNLNFDKLDCSTFLEKFKIELYKKLNNNTELNVEIEAIILTKLPDLIDILGYEVICDNNKISFEKIENFLFDVIDSFCEN